MKTTFIFTVIGLLFVYSSGKSNIKTQETTKQSDTTGNLTAKKLQKSYKRTLIIGNIDSAKKSLLNNNLNSLQYTTPVLKLKGNSKMPVSKADTNYHSRMPVAKFK